MRCATVREMLNLLVSHDGRLSAKAAIFAGAHLASCPACRRELRRLKRLAAVARSLPSPILPADLKARALADIAEERISSSGGEAGLASAGRKGIRMLQRSAVVIGLVATLVVVLLALPLSHRSSAVKAMGDVDMALRRVNTWHLKGWRLVNEKEIPWEIWGRRQPFFYHERFGDLETLDDGSRRTVALPRDTILQGVVLTLPSVRSASDNVGIEAALGMKSTPRRGQPNLGKLWSTSLMTETYAVDTGQTIGEDSMKMNSLFTFRKGSPLPVAYEDFRRLYRLTKVAGGSYDTNNLPDSAIKKQWTAAHLDTEFDSRLGTEAFQLAPHPDSRQIDAIRDSASPTYPRANSASSSGLTVHAGEVAMDAHAGILVGLDGYIGNTDVRAGDLPFGVTISARPRPDWIASRRTRATPPWENDEFRDDRGRAYTAVNVGLMKGGGGHSDWLGLTPLDPIERGAPPPRQIALVAQVSIDTYERIPGLNSHGGYSSLAVPKLHVDIPMTIDLPREIVANDLIAVYSRVRRHGVSWEGNDWASSFEELALQARVEAWWVRTNMEAQNYKHHIFRRMGNRRIVDQVMTFPERKRAAEQDFRKLTYWTEQAIRVCTSNGDRMRLRSNLDMARTALRRDLQAP